MQQKQWLIRPSDLARFWGLHPKTLYLWVRSGRLVAVRTPGGQYRVDADAVCSLARQHNLPMPPFVRPSSQRVIVVETPSPMVSSIRRSVRTFSIEVVSYPDPYDGLLAVALGAPSALVLGPTNGGFDALRCVKALRRTKATESLPVVIHGVRDGAGERAARKAGVTEVIRQGRERELGGRIVQVLAPSRDGLDAPRALQVDQ